jgi:hypothetical protein
MYNLIAISLFIYFKKNVYLTLNTMQLMEIYLHLSNKIDLFRLNQIQGTWKNIKFEANACHKCFI